MAEAVVADFERGFRHVTLPGSQELSSAFHADVAQVLLNRHPRFLREKPAEIKRAASHHPAQLFECRRLAQFLSQDGPDAFDSFPRRPLLPGAKEFAIGRAKEELRCELKGFAFEPQFLGGREDRGMPQAFDQGKERRAEASGW